MITINPTCVVCHRSEESFGFYRCRASVRVEITDPNNQTCPQHKYKKHIIDAEHTMIQDPATKCTDPADKDAVIRDLRIEKNGLLCIINSIRKDAEAAHKAIEDVEEYSGDDIASGYLQDALDAIENIIESMGVQP